MSPTTDHLAALRDESARFLGALRGADLAAPVPTCPDWVGADLLWHLGKVQWFWSSIVADHRTSPDGLDEPERPGSDHGLVQFFEEQSARLLLVLTEADPAEEVYMWADDKTVGYIRRRQAHEAAIHRLDAELLSGGVTPLDPALASDGVHEVLDVMYGGTVPWASFSPSGEHLAVVASDTGLRVPLVLGRFTGTDPGSGQVYDDEEVSVRSADPEAAPSATVSGTADDLDAWLWHRRDDAGIAFDGDPDVLARFRTVVDQPLD